MACKGGCSCSSSPSKVRDGDVVAGCSSNGCSSGGCNRMNTYDWLTALEIEDQHFFEIAEISFKNGSRKEFYKNPTHARAITGDMVLVESDNGGYDIGRVSLSGELVRLQMKKRNVKEKSVLQSVIRKANERDLERLQEAREAEKPTMVLARAIARTLSLDMKIGDVEYQGDKRKATFYYTADGRVDFRELIREFAREFKVKIEMRQIGARQESARVGGLGPCGRELCCSTWLTDFKSVSTLAARYQNLAINQSKLSGQCGRLKCCLNFELDSYMDALEQFPTHADRIQTEEGSAVLMKTDIFKGLMYYCYEKDRGRGKFYPLEIEQVKDILEANKMGQKPQDLNSVQVIEEEEDEVGFDGDLTGVVELPHEKKKKKKKNNKRKKEEDVKKLTFRRVEDKTSPVDNQPRNDKNNTERKDERRNDNRPQNNSNRPKQEREQGEKKQNKDNKNENRGEQKPQNRPPQNQERKEPRDNNNPNRPPQNQTNKAPREPKADIPNNETANPSENAVNNNNNNPNRNKNKFKHNKNKFKKPPSNGGGDTPIT